jgi:hypothetical protein
MAKIYACFNDSGQADRAVGALLDHGFRSGELSLVRRGVDRSLEIERLAATEEWNQEQTFRDDVRREVCSETRLEEQPLSPSEESHLRAAELIASDYVDRRAEMDRHLAALLKRDSASKSGLSTTTGADTEVGAVRGAGIGLGIGIAAAVASIFIPGFGFVAGGSALAAAIAGAAGTTGAGAIAGAVTGYLRDQGADGEIVGSSETVLANSGAVLEIDSSRQVMDANRVNEWLIKYGASTISRGAKRYMS